MTNESLTYGHYLRVPSLISLQRPKSEPEHHDELLFIITHQVCELWFKLILHEIDGAVEHLAADRVDEATRLVRRVAEIERLLVSQVHILETMRPQDFLAFRSQLDAASGFQSAQFRAIECALGLRDEAFLTRLFPDAGESEVVRRRLDAPSMSDALDAALLRRGLSAPANGGAKGRREEEWRVVALARLYTTPGPNRDLLALCEALVDVDEYLALWRVHHVHMVERMIGMKRGTGGSPGVPYLQMTLHKRAFPDLWRARGHLDQENCIDVARAERPGATGVNGQPEASTGRLRASRRDRPHGRRLESAVRAPSRRARRGPPPPAHAETRPPTPTPPRALATVSSWRHRDASRDAGSTRRARSHPLQAG